jgi:hypothetical protein
MKPIGSFAKAIVENCIANCDDPTEKKRRVLLARDNGILSDQEAEDWLRILEVQAA